MTTIAERKRVLRVAELVGPAGAGKSTVLRALVSRYTAVPSTIWGQSVPLLLSTGVQLGPTLAHSSGPSPGTSFGSGRCIAH